MCPVAFQRLDKHPHIIISVVFNYIFSYEWCQLDFIEYCKDDDMRKLSQALKCNRTHSQIVFDNDIECTD